MVLTTGVVVVVVAACLAVAEAVVVSVLTSAPCLLPLVFSAASTIAD